MQSSSSEELLHRKVKRSEKFFKHFPIERDLTQTERKLLELMEQNARSHGFDNWLAYMCGTCG